MAAAVLMGSGIWLHLTERHVHAHGHEPVEHDHRHRHDEHHQHGDSEEPTVTSIHTGKCSLATLITRMSTIATTTSPVSHKFISGILRATFSGEVRMLVPHYEIRLSAAEPQALEALPRAGKTPQQTVRRVSSLLLAHAGLANQAMADPVGTSRNLVQKWRTRFALYEPPPLGGGRSRSSGAPRRVARFCPGRVAHRFFPPGAPHGRRGRLPRW